MRSSYKLLIAVAALVAIFAGGRYVWPTPYRYVTVNGTLLRIERAAGKGDMLDPDKGWIPIPDAPPPYKYGWKYVRDSTPLITASPAQP